ncbi:MAG TPA: glycosyltransferase [Planctomycetota bacterium]|nr:glycosyltransferase [Planctomycetota bacterium]
MSPAPPDATLTGRPAAPADPRLSLVIPMLNESANVPALLARVFPVLDALRASRGVTSEIVAVDDGSTDGTLAVLRGCQHEHPELRIVSFARNFGQHAAVMAGFEAARGEWIVTLDADLQNPPEEIPRLVEAFLHGHDLVNTWREERDDSLFRRTASGLVNRVMRRVSGIALRDFGCMLRGYHRRVVDPMIRRREYHTFIPALATLHAHNPVEIPVAHAARGAGRSNYSLRRLFSLQLDLVTSFSVAPLRMLFLLGSVIATLGVLFGVLLLVLRLVHGPEWAASGVFTLFAVLFILVGAQFVAFGLLGEYLGRIYQEVRDRPPYLVRETFEAPAPPVAGRAEEARRGEARPRDDRVVRS